MKYNFTEEFVKKYPEYEQDIEEIEGWIDCWAEKEDCMDNFRVADIFSIEQVVNYIEQRETGCCGCVDEFITTQSGKYFLIGCNYGH